MERERNGKLTEYNKPFIEQRADPFVTCHEGENGEETYYFTASVPSYDKIVLRKSDTLLSLADAEEVTIWNCHESGDMSKHIWAPELHFLDGTWYIYFAASRQEDIWRLRPYVLECTGPDPVKDTWIERGMIQCSDDDIYSFRGFSLDSTVFENHGTRYYVWAEKVAAGVGISNLYIAKMETPLKLSTPQVLLTTPDYDWERVDIWVNEGPAILKHDGRIFLTYSASATGACYCMGMLSVGEDEDLLDPRVWVKEKKPVLTTDAEKGFFGPGHNSFTKLPDGTDVCVYHARTYETIQGDPLYDPNRHTMLMKVVYDPKGYPVFDYANRIAK
ncbi:MAG: family 43 glycosylhydrolase [Lachnospiraceae bacterium]|nr:family 43 glycosylhydrolase [Lachnospiraceae bacterium]